MRSTEPESIEELKRALAESEQRYKELQASIETRAREIANAEFQTEMMRVSSELAHDLRSPLQVMANSLFLMERKPGEITYYPKMGEAIKQATGLLDAFREYYRGHEITLMKGNINKLVERSFEEVNVPQSITISKNLDQGVPDLMLDLGKIKRVFSILIKNAIEAMPSGGTLTVSSKQDTGNIIVTVSDTGVGIPEAYRNKIFMAFGVKKRGGYGLGLAAARKIIEAHGGAVSFITEMEKGTKFTVTLPIK